MPPKRTMSCVITDDGCIIVQDGGTFYRVTLPEPAFEPVKPRDAIKGPIKLSPAMKERIREARELTRPGPYIPGTVALETALLVNLSVCLMPMEADDNITYAGMAKYLKGLCPTSTLAELYDFSKAMATIWRQFKAAMV